MTHDWIVFPIVGVIVFVLSYIWCEPIIQWFKSKSLGQRAEIIRLFELMFVEVQVRKITQALLLFSFGLGLGMFFLLWPHVVAGAIVGGAMTILGWSLPKFFVRALFERRCNRFVDQMVDGLTIMSNGIKSGLAITKAMERVVENMGSPIRQEFSLVLSQVKVGRSVEEALLELGDRIPRPDVQMFVTAIKILQETGVGLAETFGTIAFTIRERQKVEKKIEALTAQGIMQGIIITLVPFVLIVVMLVMAPNFIMPLFQTTMGLMFLAIILSLQIIGGLAIRKIVTIRV